MVAIISTSKIFMSFEGVGDQDLLLDVSEESVTYQTSKVWTAAVLIALSVTGFLLYLFDTTKHIALIVISLDGTRPEYLQRGITPHLNELKSKGFYSNMTPVFPSITFPNHYTLVTGRYPASHGIVGNTFYDPALNDTFVYTSPKNNLEAKWWLSEPIWTTAMKLGLKAAIIHWPGSEAPHDGLYPTYYEKYDGSVTTRQKFEWAYDWMTLPIIKRPNLILLYVSDIDHAGHQFGPDSVNVNSTLSEVDSEIGMFYNRLKETNLKFNLVIVSDHGMTKSDESGVYYLEDFHDINDYTFIWNGPIVFIEPKDTESKLFLIRN